MDEEIRLIIEATAQKVAEGTICDLKDDNLHEADPRGLFGRVETALYNYPALLDRIQERKEDLEAVKKYGVPQRSKSIGSFTTGTNYVDIRSEYEKQEDQIEQLELQIDALQFKIDRITRALGFIKRDAYYDLIRLKYFEQKSMTEISDHFGVDSAILKSHKNTMIKKLEFHLFPDDYMASVFDLIN